MKHTPASLKELRKLRTPIRNINLERYENLSGLEKFAVAVTRRVGTMGFFFIIFGWTILWVSWNIFTPSALRFDPYPAFVLWLIISNAIQISLMPLIMIGQNLQGKHDEARVEADYDVNTKVEREIETVIMHLENQNEMLLQILKGLNNRRPKTKR